MSLQMPTDINSLNSNNIAERRVKGGSAAAHERTETSSAKSAEAKSSTDQVQLSSQAQTLKRLEASVADRPAFDEAKVESIREAIAEGRYHVDPERLAERFVSLESELNQ